MNTSSNNRSEREQLVAMFLESGQVLDVGCEHCDVGYLDIGDQAVILEFMGRHEHCPDPGVTVRSYGTVGI